MKQNKKIIIEQTRKCHFSDFAGIFFSHVSSMSLQLVLRRRENANLGKQTHEQTNKQKTTVVAAGGKADNLMDLLRKIKCWVSLCLPQS